MSGINLGTTRFFGGETFGADGRPRDPRDTSFLPAPTQAPVIPPGGNSTITGGSGGNENLGDDFAALSDSIWNPKPASKPGDTVSGSNGTTTQTGSAVQPQSKEDQQRAYDEFIGGKQFHLVQQFSPEESAKMQQGDMTPVALRISEGLKSVYREAILDSAKLMDTKVSSAVTDAVKQADMGRHTEAYVSYMKESLPFTKEPGILPVAITVLGKFVNQGMSKEKAVENVNKYFEGMAGRVFKGKKTGAPGSQQFGQGTSPYQEEEPPFDWGSFLRS